MSRFCLSVTLASLVLGSMGFAQSPSGPVTKSNPGFDRLKQLAGTWVVADEQGKPTDQIASVMKVTAGGSAVHETLFPGTEQEMISIYTVDGPHVTMTHYCMLGNQPRMKALPASPLTELKFEFDGGGNLDPAKDAHMHAARLTFVDADHFEVEGVAWENGKPAEQHCGKLKLVRRK